MVNSFMKFLDHTQWRSTVGGTRLDEWSARRRDLYLTTYNTHNRQTFMPPEGFEPTISAGEVPQTHGLDRAATGTGFNKQKLIIFNVKDRNLLYSTMLLASVYKMTILRHEGTQLQTKWHTLEITSNAFHFQYSALVLIKSTPYLVLFIKDTQFYYYLIKCNFSTDEIL